jgi:RNA-binding protein
MVSSLTELIIAGSIMDSHTRNYLRKRAHEIKPIVMVGKSGFDQRITAALEEALQSHELVKVRFVDYKASRVEISQQLADSCQAELVTVIGNVAVVYREQSDPALRRFHPPVKGRR